MQTAFIIHGALGNPNENWFPWLKSELERLGFTVYVPAFPTSPETQTLENWLKVFEEYKNHLDKDTIVIGHSLGPAFLLTILEQIEKPIRAAYFVAGYHPKSLPKTSEWYPQVKTFLEKPFDWQKIKQNCPAFHIYHSDNDPYFPLSLAEDLAKTLDTTTIVVKNADHFNEKAGYTKFERLLHDIQNG
ncbi:MAG: alpha/beta fold hydrolase [Candidatus Gracilibacteria bacterium]